MLGSATPAGALHGARVADIVHHLQVTAGDAAARHPGRVSQTWYWIAGRAVSIRLVGTALGRELPRALTHLSISDPARPADFSIEAWDEAEVGGSAPPLREVPLEEAAPGITSVSPDGRYVLFERPNTLFGFDRVSRRLAGWVGATDRLTQYERGRPWHSELLLWQRDLGLQPLHAGFIEQAGNGILLGGPGGSGKSTTALVCMSAGWSYLADDYVALENRNGGFVGHGLYASAHLEPAHLHRFTGIAASGIPGRLAREDKSLLLLAGLPGSRLGGEASVRVLALPRLSGTAETSFHPASRAEALRRLAPSSLLLLPYPEIMQQAFHAIVGLVERIPVFWLELGRDLAQIPQAMTRLLDQGRTR